MKKKLFAFLGVAVMLMGTLTGCGETKETKKEPEEIVYIDESEIDYVYVDGKIDGKFSGENYFGSAVECPLIVDATVTKGSYLDIVTPTIAEITPAVSQDQNGVIVSVDKVE